jgi:hypothetical protein
MKSSFHSLIPFLPLFCNCQFGRLDWIQFLCSEAHILAGWRLETRLTLLNWNLLFNSFARTVQKFNGSYSIVACVFVAVGMPLPSPCLTMNIYSDFTIPAFGHHVTVCFESFCVCLYSVSLSVDNNNFTLPVNNWWALMSIKSISVLIHYFLLHISVINDNHYAFIYSKMHPSSLVDWLSQWIHCCYSCHAQVHTTH